jgi:hypothetical protein
MDPFHFDRLARWLGTASPRRRLLGGLAASALGLVATGLPEVEAKKKHKHKRKPKPAQPNEFGCISVGDACTNAEQCCSGICEGKKGKKLCIAHGEGTCDQEADGFCEAEDTTQTVCNDNPACACIRTTAGSKFCFGPGTDCADCQTDTDCEALGFPPGSACAPVATGNCSMNRCDGFVCAVPCGVAPQES